MNDPLNEEVSSRITTGCIDGYECENCHLLVNCRDPDVVFAQTGVTLKCPRCSWHLGVEP